MLIVNLLNGLFLASLVCFVVGAVLLLVQVGRSSGTNSTSLRPDAAQRQNYRWRVRAAFLDPGFRFGRTLLVAGGVVAVVSFIAMFILSASLPRCAGSPDDIDEAVSMCMPAPPGATA